MTNERDPAIESLFKASADEELNGTFTEHVMAQVEHRRRRSMFGWGVAAVVLVTVAFFAVLVLQDALFLLSQLLPPQVIELGDSFLASAIAPLNSPTGLAGVAGLLIYLAFRKLLR